MTQHQSSKPGLPNEPVVGYCTNVHPGVTLDQIKQNLVQHSLEVKRSFCPDRPMGIGLWLSGTATEELMDRDTRLHFRDWLQQRELIPYTVNAFPAGDFHQEVVKQDVYQPTWAETDRADYTVRVGKILADLLPEGTGGTISTLPLGWPTSAEHRIEGNLSDDFLQTCGRKLLETADKLAHLEQTHGVHLRLCIEPEPGCILDTADDVVLYFDQFLFHANGQANQQARVKRYLGVCHDVCHSAVMFEPQAEALDRYAEAGIAVGKVQVSSAIQLDFDSMSHSQSADALKQLTSFAEPRYLHQTVIQTRTQTETETCFHEDLSAALESVQSTPPVGIWRVHFHVPIHESNFGLISSTQSQITECTSWFNRNATSDVHFEVETYAWNVLPQSLRPDRLADGIAAELQWFHDRLSD